MIFNVLTIICVCILTISSLILLVEQIAEIIKRRKARKALKKLNDDLDKMLAKVVTEIAMKNTKAKANQTKTTTRKRSDKKED